jgi:chromosomal replication initiator protein
MFQALSAQTRARVLVDEPFLLLPEQQFAWAAATRGLDQPRHWEPRGQLTCLIGTAGSGKSLLCRRALYETARRHPRWKFVMLSGRDLRDALASAAEAGRLHDLCEATGKLAVAVCDDLDRAMDHAETAELWSAWLDDALQRGVRVLVTLADAPGRCARFSPRMVSRLHGGICAALAPLSASSRLKLIGFAAAHFQLPLTEESAVWLAERPPGTARALWEAVEKLAQQRTTPDLAAVQRTLSTPVAKPSQPQLAVIAREVADEFGVSVTQMRSPSRQRSLRLPRQCAMFLAHDLAGCPMQEIGRFFGRRAHTSVSVSCRQLQELLPGSPSLREQVARLKQRVLLALREKCG